MHFYHIMMCVMNVYKEKKMDPGPNSASPASSSSNGCTSDQRSASMGADAKEKERRVPLACLRCRAKRARCSGVRPRCKACEMADVECQWCVVHVGPSSSTNLLNVINLISSIRPEGRKRKRTRKEMEEAECHKHEATAVVPYEDINVQYISTRA